MNVVKSSFIHALRIMQKLFYQIKYNMLEYHCPACISLIVRFLSDLGHTVYFLMYIVDININEHIHFSSTLCRHKWASRHGKWCWAGDGCMVGGKGVRREQLYLNSFIAKRVKRHF